MLLRDTASPLPNGVMIGLRPSMIKFSSPLTDLGICRVSSALDLYLNRQVITLLSGLGVPDGVFSRLLADHLDALASLWRDERCFLILRCKACLADFF